MIQVTVIGKSSILRLFWKKSCLFVCFNLGWTPESPYFIPTSQRWFWLSPVIKSLTICCFFLSELSSRPSGGDPWPLAMTSMGMRQYGGDSELVIEQPSTEDLSASPNCGSNINLLEAGSSSLHYSNPVSCNFQPATSGSAGSQFSYQQSANTHFQPHLLQQSPQNQSSAETRFNGTPQLSPGKIKKQLSYWCSVFLRAVLEFLPPWNYWNCRHMGAGMTRESRKMSDTRKLRKLMFGGKWSSASETVLNINGRSNFWAYQKPITYCICTT